MRVACCSLEEVTRTVFFRASQLAVYNEGRLRVKKPKLFNLAQGISSPWGLPSLLIKWIGLGDLSLFFLFFGCSKVSRLTGEL